MDEKKYTFENPEFKDTYRHTTSHILAQAVKRLYPEVKLAIGPAIADGFYYDFDAPFAITPEILEKLEAEMRKICKEKIKLERFELPRAEAIKFMEERDEPYKVELINDLPEDAVISFYRQGDFTDLCAGPHLDSTGRVKGNAIKLTSCTGAYWRGDSDRKMLQRIYGTCFMHKDELDAFYEADRFLRSHSDGHSPGELKKELAGLEEVSKSHDKTIEQCKSDLNELKSVRYCVSYVMADEKVREQNSKRKLSAEKENCLRIPTSAVSGGAVQVQSGGKTEEVSVKTGLSGGGYTEILDGLSEGDIVVLP